MTEPVPGRTACNGISMFTKVLIANRGEIACRIIRTLRRMGIGTVAVYSEADAGARHVLEADEAILIGPSPAAKSYLDAERILAAATETGAQAIHPGYGFLSENPDFVDACSAADIIFIGPTADQMRSFGLKHTARELAEHHGVPLLPGSALLADVDGALVEAERIGYPVMLKSTAGGGGIGMQLIWRADQMSGAFDAVQRLAKANFNASDVYLEKYVQSARHIEVQIFGDGHGEVISLGERDCSVQRRNQKVIEETPAPNLSQTTRLSLWAHAEKLGRAINYRSAGTVEFVYDDDADRYYFLEVNTRLQVEHGVTEMVSGVDLVEWMVRLAASETLPLGQYQHTPRGHAIQARVYAEDPNKNFQPCSGVLTEVSFESSLATGMRVDTWVESGSEIPPFYDPLVAKLLVHGDDRASAVEKLRVGLAETRLSGIETNLEYLRQIMADSVFPDGRQQTRYLSNFTYRPATIDVIEPGVQSTIQDYPGRLGYWSVGVPPSGPMDHLALRYANRLAGNDEGVAALELTLVGPTLKFNVAAVIALTGANMQADLDGQPLSMWQSCSVQAGSVLKLGSIPGAGCRTYLAVRGGFDVPDYLGSKSTFTLGQFGGHGGRPLRGGDVLRLLTHVSFDDPLNRLPAELIPEFSHAWNVGVLYGPHGAPDFFTDSDITTFFESDWEVHYNSSRTGVRLLGPKPEWARRDGGEAGLHPSNIHDNAYAIGTVDFTGDMPVILGPDGPSLGGFVCPATIVQAELWKLGQFKPGDTVRFQRLSQVEAGQLERRQDAEVVSMKLQPHANAPDMNARSRSPLHTADSPVLSSIAANGSQIAVMYRQAGDRNLLIEYGPLVLDLNLRLRIHALMSWLQEQTIDGIIDLTPGIRSLQVHYNSQRLPLRELLDVLHTAERHLPDVNTMQVPTRIVHLPLSWDDAATQLAVEKYMQSVRRDAPWCPSNIEFIRRINGLDSIEDVKRIVFDASYLTLGLGDVYLGAPVATPMDPRHRLVTTKYNPARTWTPENAVGIGGAYLCVYGMEGPGGYQFVGRTLQMWNRWRQTADFTDNKPWLLRFFDQIRFYPVSAAELLQMRNDFPRGRVKLRIEDSTFRLADYNTFLAQQRAPIAAFKARQQTAFEAERERWTSSGQANYSSDHELSHPEADANADLPPDCRSVASHVAGSVWQIQVQPGELVKQGDTVIVLESMKMEITVPAPVGGRIVHLSCEEGTQVHAGQGLFVIQTEG